MNIIIADADDWCGLYVDGKLVMEDHDITASDVCPLIVGHTLEAYIHKEVDFDWLSDIGNFPETIEEVKWAT